MGDILLLNKGLRRKNHHAKIEIIIKYGIILFEKEMKF